MGFQWLLHLLPAAGSVNWREGRSILAFSEGVYDLCARAVVLTKIVNTL